jgi:hypothetical protein
MTRAMFNPSIARPPIRVNVGLSATVQERQALTSVWERAVKPSAEFLGPGLSRRLSVKAGGVGASAKGQL